MAKKVQKTWDHQVRGLSEAVPVDQYAYKVFPILGSKTGCRKALAAGRLLLNGQAAKPGAILQNGDRLKLRGYGLQKARSFDTEVEILYEDDYILVANKPAGIAVNGKRVKTLENALAGVAKISPQADALPRPVAVHRIDVPTKGLVLLAKTKAASIKLAKAFRENRVKKEYQAVVHGRTEQEGRVDRPLKGKQAVTEYQTLRVSPSRVFGHLSLVRLLPVTGRTHQLRIHMQQLGHLIVGDKTYAGRQNTILGKGLFLCACRLQFEHPIHQRPVDVQIQPPKRFIKLLKREHSRFRQ